MRKRRKLKKKVKRVVYFIIISFIVITFINFNKTKSIDSSNSSVDVNLESKDIYLIKGESYTINYDSNLKYNVENTNVINFNEGIITTLNGGSTKLSVTNGNKSVDLNIFVLDNLVLSTINNSKSYLSCHAYSEEDASLLDKILEFKINEKGYLTRAGVVESARFLTLNFPYKLKYFYENGRLDRSNSFFDYVDGEGRYYHKGLYLTDNKFNSLVATLRGPAPWGCEMYNDTNKTNRPNGLDCSGFVTWALVNAGFDPGDVGAGVNDYNDITDIGKIVYFTDNNAFESVKVGDLVGRKGHIAILIGKDENKYYLAEALDKGEYDMHVYSYTKEELLASELQYFVYLDDYYKHDGNLANMW